MPPWPPLPSWYGGGGADWLHADEGLMGMLCVNGSASVVLLLVLALVTVPDGPSEMVGGGFERELLNCLVVAAPPGGMGTAASTVDKLDAEDVDDALDATERTLGGYGGGCSAFCDCGGAGEGLTVDLTGGAPDPVAADPGAEEEPGWWPGRPLSFCIGAILQSSVEASR